MYSSLCSVSLRDSLMSGNPTSRSAPAQNILPAPVNTTHLTRSSTSSREKTCTSSFSIVPVKALWFLGRFNVTRTTGVGIGDDAGTWDTVMSVVSSEVYDEGGSTNFEAIVRDGA